MQDIRKISTMTNVYILAKTWRYLMIIPSVILFLLFWSLFFFAGGSLDMPFGAWMLLIVVSAISGGVIYGALTSKIVTSPEGIENLSLGIHVRATWDKVEKIEFAPDGFVNLHFKEPVYTNRVAKILRILYPYDKTIMLSPYTGELATSNLLKDLAKYVPNSNIPTFVAQQKQGIKTYQEAGVIGLYYLGWFVVWSLFALGFQKRTQEFLTSSGLPNTDPILNFIGISLVAGLFFNAIALLRRYNAEIIGLDENEISRKARTYYLGPLVMIVISFLIGGGIWVFSPTLLKSNLVVLLMFLIGRRVLHPVSSAIERILFQENVQQS